MRVAVLSSFWTLKKSQTPWISVFRLLQLSLQSSFISVLIATALLRAWGTSSGIVR